MNDIVTRSLIQLIQDLRSRRLSSVEIVDAHIKQIEAVNPALNAIVTATFDRARDLAKTADRDLERGISQGILHGIPMTIKDSLDTAGVVTTAGTTGRRNFIPDYDATVVARLKQAGAILLGKSNTPELTLALETDNHITGKTSNPYDVTLTSGGSSGGAAALIAAGGSPFDIGTDYGGSIRQPAHYCGIAGIKPTHGRVPRTGHILDYRAGATESFQTIGPLARTVADLNLLLPIISGPDGIDPYIHPVALYDMNTVRLDQLRIGTFTNNGIIEPVPDIIATINNVAEALSDQVAHIEAIQPQGLQDTERIWRGIAGADGGKTYHDILKRYGTDNIFLKWINRLRPLSGAELNALLIELAEFRRNMIQIMQPYDVLICPINADVAVPHGTTRHHMEHFSYGYHFNLTGQPCVVVRAGTSNSGLPIGVQIVAHHWREDIALAIAHRIEELFGGWQAPDF